MKDSLLKSINTSSLMGLLTLFLISFSPITLTSCADGDAGEETAAATTAVEEISGIVPVAEAMIAYGVRPEIAATDDRIFIVYHALPEDTYSVKIFNRDLSEEIATRVLVESSAEYGTPTDIRIAQDGDEVYAFYETVDGRTNDAYLRGSKFELSDEFTETASTGLISSGSTVKAQKNGDEKLDDPIPLVGEDSVFAITRYKDTMAAAGRSVYKVYEFDKEDLALIRTFDLDLSTVVDGGSRQASVLYHGGDYYFALPTTVGEQVNSFANSTPSDIVLVRLDSDWNIRESKTISGEPGDTEFYISNLQYDNGYFYMCYRRTAERFSSMLKIYDQDFSLVLTEELNGGDSAPGAWARTSILATGGQLIAGLGLGKEDRGNNSVITIFDVK